MPINPDRIAKIYIRQNTIGITSVSPARHILHFTMPLILTNMGQQLFMIVDGAIVGRGVGVQALAAVGATDWGRIEKEICYLQISFSRVFTYVLG